ncbi:MAG TPA: hypothetical protein PLV44_12180, partial [Myxococcota bacterium]|nr:hypothetical protein [Myxococcota bacterium]HPL26373.1 hypothetical protein [Myxococcota bacterium]
QGGAAGDLHLHIGLGRFHCFVRGSALVLTTMSRSIQCSCRIQLVDQAVSFVKILFFIRMCCRLGSKRWLDVKLNYHGVL